MSAVSVARTRGSAVLAGAGAAACGVGLLAASAWLIARAAEHPPVLTLTVAMVGVRAFGIGRGVLRYAERLTGHDAALRLLTRLRVRVYAALVPGAGRTGELLGRLVGDVDDVADRWVRGTLPLMAAGLAGAGAVGLEWWLLPPAGAVLLGALLFGGFVAPWLAGVLAGRYEAAATAARGALTATVVDTLHGLPELTAYGALPGRLAELDRADAELRRASRRATWTTGVASGLNIVALGVSVLGALLAARHLDGVLRAVVTLTPLAAFEAVAGLPAATRQLARSRASAARIREVTEVPEAVTEPAEPRELPSGPYELRVRDLRASWPGGADVDLTAADLVLPAGRRIAVLGRSGAGKTTLAAVLLRLLDYRGGVTLNGVELRDLAADQVRTVIGLCAQDAHLFDTTVAENVRLARPAATDADVADVLRRAGFDLDPETRVGEHGTAVSGGERQRIALARALLADVPILVLDEPDAHLDDATADAVLTDLLTAAGDRTVLLITHRAAYPGAAPVLRDVDETQTL